MLDVIADFWKPGKKGQGQETLKPEQLQIGSVLGFGFVPQAILSGRRLHVHSINTYQFGEESLTSFVLAQDKDVNMGVSMIVAESEGEHYLAISRRISINDRAKLFDVPELDAVMDKAEPTTLSCKEHILDFKGWVVPSYKREIQKLKGRIFKGDFRKIPLSAGGAPQEFEYTLLVSDTNEHAIEIEKYSDGRVEVYATVYRRMSDIGEITHPGAAEMGRPDIKLASPPAKPAEAPVMSAPALAPDNTKTAPIKLPEFTPPPAPAAAPVIAKPAAEDKPKTSLPAGQFTVTPTKETPKMESTVNGTGAAKSGLFVQANAPETYPRQEIKAVTNEALKNFETDAIECDLRVANKIIDEAIRNEMRLTDIVRRIIELPVAYPESVQIPMTLTNEDYSLLAIRYGISSSDRASIKKRIIEDLNDFSGGKKKAA